MRLSTLLWVSFVINAYDHEVLDKFLPAHVPRIVTEYGNL